MFERVPLEMRSYRQWLCWKFQKVPGQKDTKVPYCPHTGQYASVSDPRTWTSFDEAVAASSRFDGIGFVITSQDPFTCIDLDDCQGDKEALDRQMQIYQAFDSYSETSPSAKGSHIWIKGKVESGRKRSYVEVYPHSRFMTVTGAVCNDKPIQERQELLTLLWSQMGGNGTTQIYESDEKETRNDEEIIKTACEAINGNKAKILFAGEWQGSYPSQSEADFALVDIISFYTQNKIQIARIFRNSALGQRQKAKRDDYVNYMISKSFDRRLPPIDFEGIKKQLESTLARQMQNISSSVSCPPSEPIASESPYSVPPGLLGDIARFIYAAAPRPVSEIALAGAIGYMAGICGRAYNVSGTGLNQFVLLLAKTGVGKEQMASGISRLNNALKMTVPNCTEFIGPSQIASSQALLKNLAGSNTKSYVSILGEFGLLLQQSTGRNIDSNALGLRRCLLDLFNKSGRNDFIQPTIYSDKAQNIPAFQAPALSLLCESTPSEFYQALDERMIKQGLVPRFMIIEYRGDRPDRNENHISAQPSADLLQSLGGLITHALMLNASNKVIETQFTSEALKMCDEFDKNCDNRIRGEEGITRELWSRAHAKVLKLAALVAVGINAFNPIVDVCVTKWAINLIEADAHNLLARFEDGTAFQVEDNVQVALRLVKTAIKKYVTTPNNLILKSRGEREAQLHKEHIIPQRYIQQNIYRGTKNIDMLAAIKILVGNGEIIDADNKIREHLKNKYGIECFKANIYCVDASLFDN